ncbi:hypothetical protein B0H34DRAFT_380664 [Crassisporium funariophilum]|nr:hypothetical protein B0H34DRAFT_380664 [Crassisporium funariophilum]
MASNISSLPEGPVKNNGWTAGNQSYVLHSISLTSSSNPQNKTVISCLLNPALITLLPNPLPPAQPPTQNPSFHVLSTSNKGFGMFATRDIPAGELITNEHPALILPAASLPKEAYDEIGMQLPKKQREILMTMANSRPLEECPSPVEGIVRTNALALDLQFPKSMENDGPSAKLYGGVYPLINRCNHRTFLYHSCGPNAAVKWNLATLSSSLYALRAIRAGEEIHKTYVNPILPRATRVATLLKNYRFLCDCPWCCNVPSTSTTGHSEMTTPSPDQSAQIAVSDNNRALLGKWVFTHPGYLKWSTDLCRADDVVISAHTEALALIEKEGMQGLQNLFIEEIAMCYAILGDEIEFQRWGQKLLRLSKIEDPAMAAKFEDWLIDPVHKFKRWAWRKKQRMQRPGRKRLDKGEDVELPIADDIFRSLFQVDSDDDL